MHKEIRLKYIVLICFSLLTLSEFLLLTVSRSSFLPAPVNGVVIFLLSVLAGVMAMYYSCKKDFQTSFILKSEYTKYLGYFFLLLLAVNIFLWARYLYIHPVSYKESDIIPLIQKMVTHQQSGIDPYTVINEWGYEIKPTYLPMMWMPFHITEWMHIDYRHLCMAAWVLLHLWLISRYRVKNENAAAITVCLFFLQLLFFLYLINSDLSFSRTVELLVCCYYAALVLSFKRANIFLIALFLLFCLLSRFSILIWVPFLIIVIYARYGFSYALKLVLITIIGIIVFYGVPYLSKDPQLFSKMLKTYDIATLDEWNGQSWQLAGDKPYQLFRGTGLAGLFYDSWSGTTQEKLKMFQLLQLWVLIFITGILILWYWMLGRKKVLSWPLMVTGSLKIYLAFFYAFVQIPYVYLFMVPAIISVFCIYYFMQGTVDVTR